MKKVICLAVMGSCLFVGCTGPVALPKQPKNCEVAIYVSPDGFDGNVGTRQLPLRTLEGARQRLLTQLPAQKVTICLLKGRHERTGSFTLNKEDFGGFEVPTVVFKADADAVLTGSVVLPFAVWQPVTDAETLARLDDVIEKQVRFVDLRQLRYTDFGLMRGVGFSEPVYPAPMELFSDHRPMPLACWPNEGFARYGELIDKGAVPRTGDHRKLPGKVEFDHPRIAKWVNQKDAWVHGTFAWDWADKRVPLVEADAKNKTLTLGTSLYGYKPNKRFIMLNVLEELDRTGEYYIDRDRGRLYYLGDVSSETLTISLLDEPMVVMDGLSNVTWQGLTFEEGCSMAVLMTDCHGCKVVGCTIRNFGTAAVSIGEGEYGSEVGSYGYGGWDPERGLYANTAWNRRGGTHNGIVSCDIYDIGTYGIMLGGGDRKTLTPAHNYVLNCDIYRTARIAWQMFPNVSIDGVGNKVEHCHLHQNPHSAIMYWGNDHVIAYNEIDHCVYDSSDSGAIYTGRDPSGTGTVMKHNFIHHIKGNSDFEGVFLDDGTCGQIMIGNVFFDISGHGAKGIKYHGGQYNEAINNVFINCDKAIYYQLWNQESWTRFLTGDLTAKRLAAVNVTEEPYASKYPKLAKIYELPYSRKEEIQARNYITSMTDPVFADAETMDFRVTDLDAVRQKAEGFEPIPFEKIGLYQDPYRTDVGLYAPMVLPLGGEVQAGKNVTLQADRRNAADTNLKIYYTLDGCEPTTQSMLYQGPFQVSESCMIEACVIDVSTGRTSAVSKAKFSHFSSQLDENGLLYLGDMKADHAEAHNGLISNANYGKEGSVVIDNVKFANSVMICPRDSVGIGYAVFHVPPHTGRKLYFKAVLGIDDAVESAGSSEFIVEIKDDTEWREVFRSDILRGRDKGLPIDVDITGAQKLKLVTTTGHDNPNADHAAWGDARFELQRK